MGSQGALRSPSTTLCRLAAASLSLKLCCFQPFLQCRLPGEKVEDRELVVLDVLDVLIEYD